jgi:hypothetical protein
MLTEEELATIGDSVTSPTKSCFELARESHMPALPVRPETKL